MRRTVLPLLCLIPTLVSAAQVSPLEARNQVAKVGLQDLIANPSGFQFQRIKTRAIFVERGNLFNPHVSQFQPGRYQNLILWADRQALWEPEARARPLTSAYVHTQSRANAVMAQLSKYQTVEITAKVAAIAEGEAWIEIEDIVPVPAVGAFSDQSIYQIQQAITLGKESAFDLAEDHYRAALATDLPLFAKAEVAEFRAANLVASGNFAAAIPAIAQAMELIDSDRDSTPAQKAGIRTIYAKTLIETARGENRTTQLAMAASSAAQATALDPARGEAYAVLGIALAGMDRFDEARRECDKAVRLRPLDPEVRWYLGRILDRQVRYNEAIEALQQAINLAPKDSRVHKAMANAYAHRGAAAGAAGKADIQAAMTEYSLTLRLNNKDAESHVLAAQAIMTAVAQKFELTLSGETMMATPAMAIERVNAALAIDPQLIMAHEYAVVLYSAEKNYEKVEFHQSKLVESEPLSWSRAQTLAEHQWTQNNKAQAINGLVNWIKANPRNIPARMTLAKYQDQAGDPAAEATLTEVLKIDSANAQARTMLDGIIAHRLAIEKANQDKSAREKIEADRKAAEKVEADKKAATTKAAADKAAAEKFAADKAAKEKAEAERKAADKKAADKKAAEKK